MTKVAKRTVLIEEASVTPINTSQKDQLDALYDTFCLSTESIALIALPQIPEQLQTDYLISKGLQEFAGHHQLYRELTKQGHRRWQSCHFYPDYHQDLIKLFAVSNTQLSELEMNLSAIEKNLTQRVEQLSFHSTATHHLIEAQNQLITSLDSFILSLWVTEFNPEIYKDASVLKQQTINLVKQFKTQLKDPRLQFDVYLVDQLIALLLAHLGSKEFILGFNRNMTPQPACLNRINVIIHQLFQMQPNPSFAKVLAYYNLAARLDLSPIRKIKNDDLLHRCKHEQEIRIKNVTTELTVVLKQQLSQLQHLISRISGLDFEQSMHLEKTHALVAELKDKIQLCSQSSMNANQDIELYIGVQEHYLAKLDHIKQEIPALSNNSQSCIKKLEQFYTEQRLCYIDELKNAINQALYILELGPNPSCLQEIEQSQMLVQELESQNLTSPLHLIQNKAQDNTLRLTKYVLSTKAELKLKWATHLFSVLPQPTDSVPITTDTPMVIIIRHMNLQNEPHRVAGISATNPLYSELQEVNEECNLSLKFLIDHYYKLEQRSGLDLSSWMIKIRNLFQRAHELSSRQMTIQKLAHTLEDRMQNKAYLACLSRMNVIQHEFTAIVNSQAKKVHGKELNKALLHLLLQNPTNLLQKNQLDDQELKLLNLLDPKLSKLFALYQEFNQLNMNYLSTQLHLCSENDYINQLIRMTMEHLTKDCRALYALGYDFTDQYIDWLHTKVYQPLLKHYTPDHEKYSPAFFQARVSTPSTNPINGSFSPKEGI